MSPYNTRSAARNQTIAPYEDMILSPSATGMGTHIRWIYSSDEGVPALSHPGSLESEASFDRPVTPDQDEVEHFRRSPTACSIEIVNERGSPAVENHQCSPAERAFVVRMLAELQEQKKAIEELAARTAANAQPEPDRPVDLNVEGPKLPIGVIGFGREGTWVVENTWRPDFTLSTDQLPTIRESGEEVEDLPRV